MEQPRLLIQTNFPYRIIFFYVKKRESYIEAMHKDWF